MLNLLSTISAHIAFKSVGLISAVYQFCRQVLRYKDNLEEQRATVYGLGFSPTDLDKENQFDENDGYVQAATGALAILNAYSIVSGQQTALTPIITCGLIAKSAKDLVTQYRKKAP